MMVSGTGGYFHYNNKGSLQAIGWAGREQQSRIIHEGGSEIGTKGELATGTR